MIFCNISKYDILCSRILHVHFQITQFVYRMYIARCYAFKFMDICKYVCTLECLDSINCINAYIKMMFIILPHTGTKIYTHTDL